MSEILQIFHHSPPSYNQMYSQLQRECNWSFKSADHSSFRSFEEASDRFQCSEFAGNSFMNFSSSSFDELSKVTAVNEKNRSVKKRKLESVNCTSGSIEQTKARRSILNGNTKHNMDPKLDYIHVRARRGQATDSHSLAERARREKIKKKMQCLQDLVPGCNKITSKAAILDEIISYIQCLQSDVEFLTMKLAASTTSVDFNMNNSLLEEIVVQTNM